MSYRVVTTPKFERDFKYLSKKYSSLKNEMLKLIGDLSENPKLGTSIGKSCYKIRLSVHSKGKGKSAGTRVITHVYIDKDLVYLLAIYDKSDIGSINQNKIRELLNSLE